jgi:signal transduction histidine kinase
VDAPYDRAQVPDRGLSGAVEALALDMAVPVTVVAELDGRPPAPVESAVYFAVAECLANVGKHARADSVTICIDFVDGRVRARVSDDGVGGADPAAGTGMLGVRRRLAAFDGTMSVTSPPGGPTDVLLEVPCDLSSPRTTPSSAPG